MAKKQQEEILELTDIVEEGDTNETKEKDDLDKDLEELLDDVEKNLEQEGEKSEGKSLDDELNALLEGNDSPSSESDAKSSESDPKNRKEEELDIDSIFEKLDEDLSVEEENNTIKDVTADTEKKVKDENNLKDPKAITQENIDALFDGEEDEISSEKTEVKEVQKEEKEKTEVEEEIKEEKKQKGEIEQGNQPDPISEEKARKEINVDEFVINVENRLHKIEDKFSQLQGTILSKLEEIISVNENSEQELDLDIDKVIKKFDQLKVDIKASIETVDKKIQEISAKISAIETAQQDIKGFFDDLKKELIGEVHRLVPVEAAKIVREEIRALEEELEEED